jgi:hypothetical protein
MGYNAILPVSNKTTSAYDASQIASMTNSQISSSLMKGNIDPKFAGLLMNQMTTNNINTILFGNEEDSSGSSALGATSDIFGGVAQSNTSSDIYSTMSQTGNYSNVSPQYQMSVYSSLIGKTVTVADPTGSTALTGTVKSVSLKNNEIMLQVNDKLVAAANLTSISK